MGLNGVSAAKSLKAGGRFVLGQATTFLAQTPFSV